MGCSREAVVLLPWATLLGGGGAEGAPSGASVSPSGASQTRRLRTGSPPPHTVMGGCPHSSHQDQGVCAPRRPVLVRLGGSTGASVACWDPGDRPCADPFHKRAAGGAGTRGSWGPGCPCGVVMSASVPGPGRQTPRGGVPRGPTRRSAAVASSQDEEGAFSVPRLVRPGPADALLAPAPPRGRRSHPGRRQG